MTHKQHILVFDTEASGLLDTSALTSFAGVLIDENFEPVSSFYTLFKYEEDKSYSDEALELTKLSRELLKQSGSSVKNVRPTIQRLFNLADVIVCHNCTFDIGIMMRYGFAIRRDCFFDTMHKSWDVWKGEKAKLGMVCQRIGVDASGAHNSMDDVMMVVQLLKWFNENGHMEFPMVKYPIVPDYYERRTFGYEAQIEKGLIQKKADGNYELANK